MDIKSSDISARLLATENLSIVRATAQTACFDIVSRVLTIPLWKDMTPEIEDMLIAHEVGHALYTGIEYMEPIKQFPRLRSYMNVLEDVRIEKLIKRKYPGLRKRMNEGYSQLIERDFFGIKQIQSLDDLLLIDKINLYFKVGFSSGVKFDAEEKVFVDRAEKTETIDDVIQLAKEIYEFSLKKHKKDLDSKSLDDLYLDEDDGEDDDDDYQFIDSEDDGDYKLLTDESDDSEIKKTRDRRSEKGDENEESDLDSITDSAMQQKLKNLADHDTKYIQWKLDTFYTRDVVIDYKTILSQTLTDTQYTEKYIQDENRYGSFDATYFRKHRAQKVQKYNKFVEETTRTVNYLIKEFEMKKSAQLYKRARVAKTGSLNLNKLYAYKLREDLFKQVTILPQGKNHGMIMLLDWSASMQKVMHDTLEQVVSLATFCKRINIPYRVLAFSSSYFEEKNRDRRDLLQENWERMKEHANKVKESKQNIIDSNTNFSLLEFFNSEMTTSEFNDMSRRLLTGTLVAQEGFSLNSTPLNEALVWVYNNIGDYIKKHSIEKTTLITLTDGEGTPMCAFPGAESGLTGHYWDEDKRKYCSKQNFIKDDVTQKTYPISGDNARQTLTLLNMIKDRYQIKTIGFHIVENDRRSLGWAINANLPDFQSNFGSLIDSWKKQFRDNGFALVNNSGRDELYMIPCSSTKIVETSLEVNNDSTARSIAKSFGNYMNTKRTSRILLNRFINVVA